MKNYNVLTIPKQFDIFPVKIYHIYNKDVYENKKTLIAKINTYKSENKGVIKSNIGGYHSRPIENLKEFKDIKLKLIDCFAAIISMCYGYECMKNKERYASLEKSLDIMWFIVSGKGHLNQVHTHPRAWLSCVYYISLPKKQGMLNFKDPINCRTHDGDYIKQSYNVFVSEGDFIFFPGWLAHSVPMNQTDEERVVISCNFRKPNFIVDLRQKYSK